MVAVTYKTTTCYMVEMRQNTYIYIFQYNFSFECYLFGNIAIYSAGP